MVVVGGGCKKDAWVCIESMGCMAGGLYHKDISSTFAPPHAHLYEPNRWHPNPPQRWTCWTAWASKAPALTPP